MKKNKKQQYIDVLGFHLETLILKKKFSFAWLRDDELQETINQWRKIYSKNKKDNSDNCLWNSILNQPYLEGDAAAEKYNKLKNINSSQIILNDPVEFGFRLTKGEKINYNELTQIQTIRKWDIYIIGKDFKWAFVLTHEDDFGPYFSEPLLG